MPSIEQLESLRAASPDDPFLMYGLALEHAKAEQHDEALTWFDQCLANDPEYCYAFYHKAKSLEMLRRFEDAAEVLRDGIKVAKSLGDAHAESELNTFLEEFE